MPAPDGVALAADVTGVVLAAGAGRRFGGPKALVPGWLAERVEALHVGGCTSVLVVLGASAEQARPLVPAGTRVVVAADWGLGMGASLQAGLRAAHSSPADAVLVALVDVPGLTAQVVARMLHRTGARPTAVLAQAVYGAVAGHPVLLGREHWDGVLASAHGDRGARDYLAGHDVLAVECGDVGDGRDVDTPEDLPRTGQRGAPCAR